MPTSDEIKLKELVKDFISILEKCDEEKFKAIWHEKAIRFGFGNSNELITMNKEEMLKFSINGLKKLKEQIPNPDSVKFHINKIIQVKCIEGVLGFVELKWQMKLPSSKGTHHSIIHFVKHGQSWVIANVLEKGFEVSD